MATVQELLSDAGDLLQLATSPVGLDMNIRRLIVWTEATSPTEASLVVGAGLGDPGLVAVAIDSAASRRATGIVIRSDIADPTLIRRAEQARIVLLLTPRSADWMDVILLLNAALARTRGFGTRRAGPDLFALADLIADAIDAPVTIDDSQFKMMAYSGRQDEADEPRRRLILARGESNPRLDMMRRIGFFQRLAASPSPVYYHEDGMLPRVVMAVRGGGEMLGSIWGAVREPLTPDREKAMMHAAGLVATHLLRERAIDRVATGTDRELADALLAGGPSALEAGSRLGLSGSGFRVLSIVLEQAGPTDQATLTRLRDLLTLRFSSMDRPPVTLTIADNLYAVMPVTQRDAGNVESLESSIRAAASRVHSVIQRQMYIGIGVYVSQLENLDVSRSTADRVARLLRSSPAAGNIVAEYNKVESRALLADVVQAFADDLVIKHGAVARLVAYDMSHGSPLCATLRAYFEACGSPDGTAAILRVHRNTVRNRLRAASRIGRFDLDDPEDRLAVALQLHILRLHDPG